MKGKIYLICDPNQGLYKIGVTRSRTEKRIKQLQTGNGTLLHISCLYETDEPFRIEKMLHARFAIRRQEGEWFALEPSEAINFLETCQEMEAILDSLKDNPYMFKQSTTSP